MKKENDIIQSDSHRFICQIDGIDAFVIMPLIPNKFIIESKGTKNIAGGPTT